MKTRLWLGGADPVEFGVGPHVSWRFVMMPLMGSQASLVYAGRKEITEDQAQYADCLGEPCLSLTDPSGPALNWQPLAAPQLAAPAYAWTTRWLRWGSSLWCWMTPYRKSGRNAMKWPGFRLSFQRCWCRGAEAPAEGIRMRKISMAAVAMAVGLTSGAWAQSMPVYESTGTLELVIEGKPATYHTTSNTVPNQPGRRVDTARWRVSAPMMMGGVNIAPPGILVSLSARPAVEPDSSLPELRINFSLDENDHTLLESRPFEVIYTVKEGPQAGEYKHASGALQILSVTAAGENVLKITGRADGKLAVSTKDKKGSGAGLNYEVDFSVDAYRF